MEIMEKEKKKSPVSDALHIAGIVFSAVFSFIALVHTFNGNVWLSAFITLVVVVLLYFLPERLAHFKSLRVRRQVGRAKEDKWQEKALLAMYAAVALPLFVLLNHFVNVEFYSKNRIKLEGIESWNEVRRMEGAYQSALSQMLDVMEVKAKSAFSQYMSGTGPSRQAALDSLNVILGTSASVMSEADFETAVETKKNASRLSYSLDKFKTDRKFDTKVKEAEAAIKNWDILKVGYHLNESDVVFEEFLKEAKIKMPGFDYARTSGAGREIGKPMQSLLKGSLMAILISLIVAVLVNLFLLAPYISAKRVTGGLGPSGDDRDVPGGIEL
jgi:hypothetical protein